MTNRDKTIAGLKATGWIPDTAARTSKYLVLEFPGRRDRILIGRSGAIRKTPSTVAMSISLTGGRWHKALQTVGERAGQYSSVEQAQADLRFLLGEPAAAGAAALKGGA